MADHEARIGGAGLSENTQIKTNVKTLLWVSIGLFSALISIFTIFYFDMRAKDNATNDRLDEVVIEIKEDVETTVEKELRIFEERQLKIKDDIGYIRGDIRVILDRTSNHTPASNFTINDHISPPADTGPPADAIPGADSTNNLPGQ